MVTTYSLGVFNDNFFKQAAMLLAVAAGKSELQGTAAILFSLPFILFSAPAGWLADKFIKTGAADKIIIGATQAKFVTPFIRHFHFHKSTDCLQISVAITLIKIDFVIAVENI